MQVTSTAEMTFPSDANIAGNVHGGEIMKRIDKAGWLAASRHARRLGNPLSAFFSFTPAENKKYLGECGKKNVCHHPSVIIIFYDPKTVELAILFFFLSHPLTIDFVCMQFVFYHPYIAFFYYAFTHPFTHCIVSCAVSPPLVTACLASMDFVRPAHVGDILNLTAWVVFTSRRLVHRYVLF